MENLFRYCDLPTRCKLRRVSHYWKRLASREDVNEVVIVDETCCLVSTKTSPWLQTPSMNAGFSTRNTYCIWDVETVNLEKLSRHGLMGFHAQSIIYRPPLNYCLFHRQLVHLIRTISMYFSNVCQIALCKVVVGSSDAGGVIANRLWASTSLWKEKMSNKDEPKFHHLKSARFKLRVPESDDFYYGTCLELATNVSWLKVEWRDGGRASLDPFIWPYPKAQRDWFARCAPLLPQYCHKWIAEGLTN
ncbi:hypothetical protein BV898_00290 [Hypsibius exemplaris]|uniref:F-box domain-containing protein n=1 Tax=Hypsibius exemplaris TaxID=2072580 RepID=A0A1W0XFA6_HYPEX|nr:hypothetical protein BV898_00290 [Hypsibius exemplaris]